MIVRVIVVSLFVASCATTPFNQPIQQPVQPYYQQQTNSTITYRVRKGDTLSSIAKRYNMSHINIATVNQLRPPYTIYVGQVLNIPLSTPHTGQLKAAYRGTTSIPSSQCAPMPRWSWATDRQIEQTISQTGKGSGINILGKLGQDIKAAAAGTVVFSGVGPKGYQNLIIIQHSHNLLTVYGHNRQLWVRKGQRVAAGQKIAQMGLDARRRPILHFEIRCHNKAVEPLIYLPK